MSKTLNKETKPSCNFCGAEAGEISQRTEQKVTAIYDCEKCCKNYCSQCRYFKEKEPEIQLCLQCDSKLWKLK